jgi:hypothetical protein
MTRLITVGLLILHLVACKKNQLGGSSVISGRVSHHSKPIPNAMVYVKLGAKEFPGTDSSRYDAKIKANSDGFYRIECYRGDYYLYATGIDLQSQPLYVRGGTSVTLRKNESAEIEIAVTEI